MLPSVHTFKRRARSSGRVAGTAVVRLALAERHGRSSRQGRSRAVTVPYRYASLSVFRNALVPGGSRAISLRSAPPRRSRRPSRTSERHNSPSSLGLTRRSTGRAGTRFYLAAAAASPVTFSSLGTEHL